MSDLLKKLKDSGLILNKEQLIATRSEPRKMRLEDLYQGRWEYGLFGDVFIMNEIIPYGEKHGGIPLVKHLNTASYLEFEKKLSAEDIKVENIAFIDIETSSLSFGAGSFVFLIGVSYFSEVGLESSLSLIDHPSAEKALLEKFNKDIEKFNIICTYNGKSFDVPFIRNRCAFHRVDNIIDCKNHIDLLFYARRMWKLRIDSCKLSHVEETILRLQRDAGEIPGWMVPQVFFDFLNEQDPHLLDGIISHNKVDVISLAVLFQHISRLLTTTDESGHLDVKDCFSLAKMHESNGRFIKAKHFYKIGLQANNDKELTSHYCFRYGMLLKRTGEISEAVQYWEESAATGCLNACIELSKYYEHTHKDYYQALKWATKAQDLISSPNDVFNEKRRIPQLEHRVDRINRKIISHEKQKI